MDIIKIEGVSYSRKGQKILNNLSYNLEKGKMTAIIGASGKGKTTLLNILGMIEKPTEGKIIYENQEIKKQRQKNKLLKEKISFIFQNYALIENKTVQYNVALGDLFYKRKKNKILKALKDVGLSENFLKRKVSSLSGGERQRVAIARAIYRDSNIILADEPTGNLDEKNSQKVMQIFEKMKKNGATVVVVTHNLDLIKHFDNVLEL